MEWKLGGQLSNYCPSILLIWVEIENKLAMTFVGSLKKRAFTDRRCLFSAVCTSLYTNSLKLLSCDGLWYMYVNQLNFGNPDCKLSLCLLAKESFHYKTVLCFLCFSGGSSVVLNGCCHYFLCHWQ